MTRIEMAMLTNEPRLSVYKLARLVQMSEYRLGHLLKGRVKYPSDDEIRRIADALKLSPDVVREEIAYAGTDHREKIAREPI